MPMSPVSSSTSSNLGNRPQVKDKRNYFFIAMQSLRGHFSFNRCGWFLLKNRSGQSTVEYVAVLTAIFLIAGLGRGTVSTLAETIRQKYRSYCFSVAISDPPGKKIDQLTTSDDPAVALLAFDRMTQGTEHRDPDELEMPVMPDIAPIKDFVNQAQTP